MFSSFCMTTNNTFAHVQYARFVAFVDDLLQSLGTTLLVHSDQDYFHQHFQTETGNSHRVFNPSRHHHNAPSRFIHAPIGFHHRADHNFHDVTNLLLLIPNTSHPVLPKDQNALHALHLAHLNDQIKIHGVTRAHQQKEEDRKFSRPTPCRKNLFISFIVKQFKDPGVPDGFYNVPPVYRSPCPRFPLPISMLPLPAPRKGDACGSR